MTRRGTIPGNLGGGGGGSGNVTGPGVATDNAVARYNGISGTSIQNSVVTISDTGATDGITTLDISSRLTIADDVATPPLNITERSVEPTTPSSGDIYLDDGTNTGSGNPGWRRYTGAVWEDITAAAGGGSGDVVGPGSATDEALVRFDGVSGTLVQNSVGTLTDAGVLAGLTGLTVTTGDTNLAPTLTISDSATTAPLNVTERSAAPSVPASGDIYLDDGTNTGSGNPGWRRYTGAVWEDITAAAGGGGGTFPGSSTDNAIVRFDGTGGSTVQNSVVTVDDSGNMDGTVLINSLPHRSAEFIDSLSTSNHYQTPSTEQWAGNGTGFTVCAIVAVRDRDGTYSIIAHCSDDFSRGWRLEYESDNFRFRVSGTTSSVAMPAIPGSGDLNLNMYYILHGVYDGTDCQLFVNGHGCSANVVTFTANSTATNGQLGYDCDNLVIAGYGFDATAWTQAEISDHVEAIFYNNDMVDAPSPGFDNMYVVSRNGSGAPATWNDEIGSINISEQGTVTTQLCRPTWGM